MKIQICDSRKYLFRYLIFVLAFLFALVFLSLLRLSLVRKETPTESTPTPAPIVVIDAGHGGEDCGAVGRNGVLEKDLNLQIAQKLERLLLANGIQTVMTRSEDVLLYDKNSDYHGQKKVQDLATRKSIAEQYENTVFISIHMNSFPQSQYDGLQVYYSPHHTASQQLARDIQTLTQKTLQPSNHRTVKSAGENIYLLNQLTCPAVLVECGFLSNREECERLIDERYQQQLALVIALSVLQNLSPPSP